jgi:hypothetical protein
VLFGNPSFNRILKTVSPAIAIGTRTCEKQLLSFGFYSLRYATGNNFEDLKFMRVLSRETGIIVIDTCLILDRQTVTA